MAACQAALSVNYKVAAKKHQNHKKFLEAIKLLLNYAKVY
jgi:hypothetical protein